MPKAPSISTLEVVKAKLREVVLSAKEGALIGSEESLIADLAVSRSTLRQAARLLEREGLLRVKRGINGGYYGSRPDEKTIQTAVSAYLGTLDMKYDDVTAVASSVGRFPLAADRDGTPQHREFVRAWREAKLLELAAIEQGDVELGMMAARNGRNIWHRRFWSKKPG